MLLLIILSQWFFFYQHNGVVSPSMLLIFIFWVVFWVSSLPMSVTTHSDRCLHPNYFAERLYCRHIPPLGSLLLDLFSAAATTPSMVNDLVETPYLYSLFLPLVAHLSKIVHNHYTKVPCWYHQKMGTPAGSGVHLVVAIDSHVVVHAAIAWRQRYIPNQFVRTDEIIRSGRQLWKCGHIHGTIAFSPRVGVTTPPRRWQDPPAFHWQFQWLWIPCLLLYFDVYPSFLLTEGCDRSLGYLLSFLTT